MRANVAAKLTTDTAYLQDLISSIKDGELKVPQFQRKFVWKEVQALDLLDSVANNYPIGSLLLWRTTEKLSTERNIGDFQLPDTDDQSPTDYVLDGQQRLTVIYSCMGAPFDAGGFAAGYNLINEQFVEMPEVPPLHVFPLRRLYDTTDLLNFRTALQAHPEGGLLQQRLDELVQVLTRYKLPVVTLKHLTLLEVCPIFERINSSGTDLSTFDLMVAATWSNDFDLNQRVEAVQTALEPKGFEELQGTTVLKILSALRSDSTAKEAVLGLRKATTEELDTYVTDAREALKKAVDTLGQEFKVHSLDFLPYEAHLIATAYLLAKQKALSRAQVERLRQWFWRSAFTERYRGASDAFVSRDLHTVWKFVAKGEGAPDAFGAVPTAAALASLRFRKNNSGSRAFSLALAKLNPRNLTNGAAIDTYEALSAYNKNQFHHIFPQAYLREHLPKAEKNWLLNICMLAASENNEIGAQSPNEYLPYYLERLGPQAETVLASNAMPSSSLLNYASVTYDEFLARRGAVVQELVESLCDGQR